MGSDCGGCSILTICDRGVKQLSPLSHNQNVGSKIGASPILEILIKPDEGLVRVIVVSLAFNGLMLPNRPNVWPWYRVEVAAASCSGKSLPSNSSFQLALFIRLIGGTRLNTCFSTRSTGHRHCSILIAAEQVTKMLLAEDYDIIQALGLRLGDPVCPWP
jgi:hypothetical protein